MSDDCSDEAYHIHLENSATSSRYVLEKENRTRNHRKNCKFKQELVLYILHAKACSNNY